MKVLAIVLGLLALALILVIVYFFQFAIYRKPLIFGKKKGGFVAIPGDTRIQDGMDWFHGQEKERIVQKSYDGLNLVAELIPAEGEAKGVLILMHGFHGSPAHDFSGAFRLYHSLGYHLLCVHQRAHGASEGRYITYGVKERYDCQMWAKYASERFGKELPIVLDGISMGATTVLMASALPMPENVRGIIADCGFTSPFEIFSAVMYSWFRLKPFPLLYLVEGMSRLVAGFGFKDYSVQEAMKENKLPVLFIHGVADDFVPCRMTEAAYEVCRAPKEMILVEKAGHGVSFLLDEERCTQALIRFLGQFKV